MQKRDFFTFLSCCTRFIEHWWCLFVGMIIIVDDSNDLTSWFYSPDPEPQLFDGVELSKRNESLVVSYATGIDVIII